MLKMIGGVLGALFVFAAYKLATSDGTQTVAPPEKAASPKKPASSYPGGGGGGGVNGHQG